MENLELMEPETELRLTAKFNNPTEFRRTIDKFWETATLNKKLEKERDELRTLLFEVIQHNQYLKLISSESSVQLIGNYHKIQVSKEKSVRTVKSFQSMKQIHKILGNKFYEIVKINSSDLEAYLSAIDLKKYTNKDYTGVRTFTPSKS